jgi:hypothetical protein
MSFKKNKINNIIQKKTFKLLNKISNKVIKILRIFKQ